MQDTQQLVFVYGTLRKHDGNHYLQDRVKRVGVRAQVYRPTMLDVLVNGQKQPVLTFTVWDKEDLSLRWRKL
ncbi:AIG2 family protein [Caldalkalibacillus thermarum TA2.A1]|uniref:AIG2 family protein n=1 Tax=Caldalkalibacillus thermarum (strain TA2.A1) TaxID=986075 RepID=F5L5Z0_CALTT|nr:hypothetical protein [Caldalkalibacillus thermarum]EGL83231.1 AIG2 family protein [Caldalkalibacillus thermarum TA2.A1]QZT35188.1 gamma-glutamylcyclotransferase [Caldalkalibacillus thermarum TA2.A1]